MSDAEQKRARLRAGLDQAWAEAQNRYAAIERLAADGPLDEEFTVLARWCAHLVCAECCLRAGTDD